MIDSWMRQEDVALMRWLRRQPHHMALPLFIINREAFHTWVGYYKALREAWERAELIGGLWFRHHPGELFDRAGHEAMMSLGERRKLAAMRAEQADKRVKLYRGTMVLDEEVDVRPGRGIRTLTFYSGWSWTTSESKAEWFAGRYGQGRPVVVSGHCHPNDILALLDGRGEDEVIIDPRDVAGLRSRKLPERDVTSMDYVAEMVRKYGVAAVV